MLLLACPVKNWRILFGAKFRCPHALADKIQTVIRSVLITLCAIVVLGSVAASSYASHAQQGDSNVRQPFRPPRIADGGAVSGPLRQLQLTDITTLPTRVQQQLYLGDCTTITLLLYWAVFGRVVSVLDSGAEGPGSNHSRDAVG